MIALQFRYSNDYVFVEFENILSICYKDAFVTNGEPVILFFHSAKENWQARIFFIGWQKHSPLLYLRWREDQFKQNIVPFRSFASSPNNDRQLMVIVKNNIYAGKSCSNHQEPLEEIVGKVAKALVDNFWQPFHPQLTCVVHSNFPETPLLRQACDAIMLWMASSMIQEVLPKTRAMGLMEIEKLPSCSEIWFGLPAVSLQTDVW